MAVKLHTSQLNVGKLFTNRTYIWFLDTTVRTGNDFVKRYLAPDWGWVSDYKNKSLTPEDYSALYVRRLYDNKEKILAALEGYCGAKNITDMVIGCYCTKGSFCHRHLLKRFLLKESEAWVNGGEIDRNNIYTGDEPHNSIITVSGTESERNTLLKALGTTIGAFATNKPMELLVDDKIDLVAAEVDLLTQVVTEAKKANVVACRPFIDVSGLGELYAKRVGTTDEIFKPLIEQDELTVPWYYINGADEPLDKIRSLLFKPSFEIFNHTPDAEFEAKLDTYFEGAI